MGFFFLILDS